MSGFWAVLHQYLPTIATTPSQKQFADAILASMRETIPQEWTKFRDQSLRQLPRHKPTENFRVLK